MYMTTVGWYAHPTVVVYVLKEPPDDNYHFQRQFLAVSHGESKSIHRVASRAGVEPASVEPESTVLSIILPGHAIAKVLYYMHSL